MAHVGETRHAMHEKKSREHHPDLDGDGEIDEHCKDESGDKDNDVAAWGAELRTKDTPFAHLIGHHEQDARECGHGNERCPSSEEERDEQHSHGVHHSRDRRAAAILDVRRRARDRSSRRNAAEQW